ncbi:diguanylate cyclase [Paucibacter sp. APW11]|uniref:Diguanylate cyclase n=1 Tax=Roseateles aquae TaxID=3077235 RepID=A0ABU3P9J3_9BURK|nr:diguanylate cyclase [Paucibacter sp. APW11]MDT8999241.1 diguanylate cyclase [Paucibacter sp. APW11]
MQLAGFTLKDTIYSVGETVVASAVSAEGQRVVLKYLQSAQPAPEQLARWRHEYQLLSAIDSPWIIKAEALLPVEHSLVLVLEDFAATNLAELIARQALDLSDRLGLALQLCRALSAVHQHHLIHGDIAPKNVLVDLATLRLKLCDFGLASRLEHAQQRGDDVLLRGTLEYMAPEQTGRTNLEVDYRSDFYSLGVTLYELFSGRKPFQSSDPMTLLHAQLAVTPMPLHQLDPGIPEPLSAIVQKLLDKHPDQRYQSSFGLQHDLERCAMSWLHGQQIEPFELAQADTPERFCVAQRLYGRDAELATMLAAFERASSGQAELLFVSGYSGIGKTALVSELHRPVVARRGYFLRGKCDQYSRNQPYAALIQAFQQLMQQLAIEGEERRHYWRSELQEALGEQAGAVAAIIPNLSLLIGAPPPLPALPAAETEKRFHIAFAQFVRALARRSHPLLLFLDDLQWADAPTLRLLEHLLSAEGERSVLIIGAYRDNEVDEQHPLAISRAALARRRVEHLQLGHLAPLDVAAMVADTLRCKLGAIEALVELCLEKTRGNPFFLGQFLRSLHEQGDIHYVRGEGVWRWNIEQIRRRGMTDNVVTLMLDKLRALAEPTQALLARAALLGDSFDLRELMAIAGADAQVTAALLWPALQLGLVLPLNEDYKFEDSPELLQSARYRFLHDRVQQAAHELTPAAELPSLQLQCGRALLAASSADELEQRLFIILECLNQASALMADPAERQQLLALNLRGGVRAKAASAFAAAVALLRQALALLGERAWQQQPEQTLAVYRELAEAEYLAGNFDAAEAIYPGAIAACGHALAKVQLALVQADQYHIQGRFGDAHPVLLQALQWLERPLPDDEAAAGALFQQEFGETEALLAQRSVSELLQAAEMNAPERLLEMRLYYALTHSSYQTGRFAAFVLVACRMVHTTLLHGQGDLSSIGYVAYMTAMSVMKRPYPDCYRMGKLALSLAEQRDNPYFRLTVYQYFPAFYQHWCEALPDSFPYLQRGMELGQLGINPLSAGYATLLLAVNRFVHGAELEALEIDSELGLRFLQQSRQPHTEAMLRYGVLQPLRALRGRTTGALSFDSEDCSSSAFFNGDYRSPSIPLALYSTAMLRHAYLFDSASLWQQCAPNLALIGQCLPDGPSVVEANFYVALGRLREGFVEPAERAEAVAQAAQQLALFAQWAEGCESNFLHKQLLIAAELARVRGEERAAMDLFAQAIDAAAASGFVACEALANERYAEFWLAQQQKQLASNFIREAHYHYRRWGAWQKCRQLEQRWPQIAFKLSEQRPLGSGRTTTLRSSSEGTGQLDLHSLLKANQLLAKELQLESLLQQMLGVLLESAGAEQGAIVLDEDDQLIVEALGGLHSGQGISCQRISLPLRELAGEPHALLPSALIEFVKLTRSTLILNNPASDERFARNHYLRERRPKSVICLPVLNQGKLVALVYLENNLLENAFTARHQQTLELLSAQAAISLVNARLYENLEAKVQQRTEELRQMSMKDGLTGIANRRAFDERLSIEWRRGLRQGLPLSLLMIDIDHFKQFNDHYGHLEGDRCIKLVAQALAAEAARAGDLVARYGGEEFAVLLPDSDAEAAARMAQACIDALNRLALPHERSPAAPLVSISVGHSTVQVAPDSTPEQLVAEADQALYRAKRAGRNQAVAFDALRR